MNKVRFSVVVPAYNEEAVIKVFHDRLIQVLQDLHEPWELIYINDGSEDQTGLLIERFCAADSRVKCLSFSRNFGHQAAITAGMDHTSGDAVIIIDADLQDPPEVIPRLIDQWRAGYDVVYGRRIARQGESAGKKLSARLYYRLLRRMTSVDIPVDVGDFRLVDRRVSNALSDLPEHNRYVRGLISWLGFRQTYVDYVRAPRYAGTTKYPLKKMIRLAADGITSFSFKPLKMGIGIGVGLSVLSFLFLMFVFIARLFNLVIMEPGYASLMCVILFFFGIILIMLGIIGEYIARIFEEVKNRPLYVIARKTGQFNRSGRCPISFDQGESQ
ncbi:MAG: glycosyltransferase family 2 protein [Eubacteriales bacterium]|jgi:dolichol-phosphate mannosyltransferase|nr:glycosyltransferase family 2 protein [Eubacteriales bacterium]